MNKHCHVVQDCVAGCHFPIGILGQMWCLIVSIPDLCHLSKDLSKGKVIRYHN